MRNSYLAGRFWVNHSLNGLAAASSNFQDSAVGNFHAMSTESLEIAHRDGINLSWLVKLRWAATIGQVVAIGVVHEGMGIRLRLAPLLALIALGLATNVVAFAWTARGRRVAPWALPALMIFDTLLFTLLLHQTGGPFNPFSFLYLVYIALAAVVLPARLTWALVFLSLACSGFLFLDYEELPLGRMSHDEHMRIHLIGMWVAFGVAAAFIVYFLLRVTVALTQRNAELDQAKSQVARQEKLASLATLAAGTAHELATPLSTIALVARELDRELSDPSKLEAARADAKLIREQVQRCRTILDGMSARGGEFAGESHARVDLSAVVGEAVSELAKKPPIRVDLGDVAKSCKVEAPPRALALTIQNLLKNAQDASAEGQEVVLSATIAGSRVCIEVRDEGTGMPREVLERVGEPFFTTKPPGGGMGLGLFVSRAMVERLGGELRVTSTPSKGTCVTIDLPVEAATTYRTLPA
jgi:two-component system sensor histidine kinase RegB